ncbi:Nitrogen fixation protein of unknown function [Fulvimarina manganoxydans]|uniref:Nif11 domain-containing protein n=1 Tax=Fulvimarina manganoxydans TaxID=937218 RepID=A0A1W2D2X9_9HYPH|nr:Nif11-like leader peptide family natural product precursor [Fulvimarina manganoxydans]SMC91915.1 Nitrogen fixation protein of unknown function [Fulvimarina manganoxydans]
MSIEGMSGFAAAVRADDEMGRELAATLNGKAESEAQDAFSAFARQRGFDVTASDLEATRQAAADHEGTLADDHLDAVAGGTFSGGPMGLGGRTPYDPILDWAGGLVSDFRKIF